MRRIGRISVNEAVNDGIIVEELCASRRIVHLEIDQIHAKKMKQNEFSSWIPFETLNFDEVRAKNQGNE